MFKYVEYFLILLIFSIDQKSILNFPKSFIVKSKMVSFLHSIDKKLLRRVVLAALLRYCATILPDLRGPTFKCCFSLLASHEG